MTKIIEVAKPEVGDAVEGASVVDPVSEQVQVVFWSWPTTSCRIIFSRIAPKSVTNSLQFWIIIGNFIGFVSVPLGIGGGSLSVPFMRLFGYDLRKAIGTSAAIGILIAISGTVSMVLSGALFAKVNSPLSFGYFNLAGFLVFVPVTMMMAPLGAKVVHKVSRNLITKVFGVYLILISLRSFIEYLNIK